MNTTFQPPSKSLTSRDYLFIVSVVAFLVLISGVLIHINLGLKGGGDFYTRWEGSRAFLFDKIGPYGLEVATRTQELVYGGTAKTGDEPYILDTPFPILLFYFPFSLLSDALLARALFTLLLELALMPLAYFGLRLADWEAPRFFFILFILLGIFNFYSWQAIYEANPVVLLGLIYAGILLSLRFELDELAGALIAVSLYYWEVGGLFLLLVALRVFYQKQKRVLAGFFMLTFISLVIAFLLYPGWVIPFMRAAVNNLRAGFGFDLHAIFIHVWPAYGQTLAWIFITLLIILLGYEFIMARGADFRRFYWTSCVALAAAPLLGFRSQMENLVVLVIPLALVCAVVHDRWRGIGKVLAVLLMLLVFGVPWGISIYAPVHYGRIAKEMVFLFFPVFTLVSLYWIRWWALRPPRIWSDLAKNL